MEFDWFMRAFRFVEILSSQELIDDFLSSSFPHLDKVSRQKIHREVYKRGWPDIFSNKKAMSLQDLAKIIKGNNGVI